MEVAAPLPATHAMDPASPARPMVASAALPHSAVAPAATPMQGLPAATVNARPGPGQSGAASTQPNQAGQRCLGVEFGCFGSQSFGSVCFMMSYVYACSVWF